MKRSIWIFLLAILLPSIGLGWLALRSANEQQIVLERRTAELYQKETDAMASAARSVIEEERRGFAERVRQLFDALERGESFARLLELANTAAGVQIFIGADNALFGVAGCSVIVAPYANSREQVVGAIGVIGPTRINYARIIPLVDYTAKVVGRLLG